MRRVRTGDQEDPGTRAPRDQGTKGPGDQGTRGPRDQRTRGPEEQGTEDQGTRGPGDQRIKGTLNCFSSKFRICFQGLRFLQKKCFFPVSSPLALPMLRYAATLLYILLRFHTFVMLRHCTFL